MAEEHDAAGREELNRLGRELLALPPGVGCGVRRQLLAELAWGESPSEDEVLREAIDWIRGRH